MKILRKPVKAIVECPLCNCEYEISGKDWSVVEKNHRKYSNYLIDCPNCHHPKHIVPSEAKCRK
jgi:hypothetical protein